MAVKDSMDAILARLDSMENTIVNLQHEVTSANLRAENAELKLQLSAQEKHKEIKQKPLGKGKNRSNPWLDEIVFYTPPRSYDPKELYCDGAVNGKHWRLIRKALPPTVSSSRCRIRIARFGTTQARTNAFRKWMCRMRCWMARTCSISATRR